MLYTTFGKKEENTLQQQLLKIFKDFLFWKRGYVWIYKMLTLTNDWALGACLQILFYLQMRKNKLDIVSKNKKKLQLWLHSNRQIYT